MSGESHLPLWHGSGCYVPREIAKCPECGSELQAKSNGWVAATGQPNGSDIDVYCANDPDLNHRFWQSDWQPVMDAIRKWCKATND